MSLQDFSFSRSDRKRHIQIDFNWLCVSRVFVKRYDMKREEATNILGIFHRTKQKSRFTNNFKNPKPFAILLWSSRHSFSLYPTIMLPLIDDLLEACKVFVHVFFIYVNGRIKKKNYVLVSRAHNMYIPTCSRTRESPTPPTALYVPTTCGRVGPSTNRDCFVHGKSTGFRTLVDQAMLFATFVSPYHNVQRVTHIRIHTRTSKSNYNIARRER